MTSPWSYCFPKNYKNQNKHKKNLHNNQNPCHLTLTEFRANELDFTIKLQKFHKWVIKHSYYQKLNYKKLQINNLIRQP